MKSRFARISKKLFWIFLIVVVLAGAGGYGYYRWRQAQASVTQTSTLQTATVRQGDLVIRASGTGTLIAVTESDLVFSTSGKLESVLVKVGDKVEAGQLLAQLDDSSQQTALAQAKQDLLELTSPSVIALAQQSAAQYQQDVYNDEVALTNVTMRVSQALIDDAYAAYVIAKDNLKTIQERYEEDLQRSPEDTRYARAYQEVYDYQVAMNNALGIYNLYTGYSNPAKVAEKKATVALDKANLQEAQYYLAALTGSEVPADATGTALAQLNQAKLNLQSAEDDLAATKLYAPFAGMVMAVDAQVGESAGSGTTILTLADLSQANIQFYMDESDWSNIKVGYDVEVTFDALPDQVFTGKVVEVMPSLVTVQGSSMIEGLAQLDNSIEEIQLPVYVAASVDVIAAQAKNAVLVPVEALHEISAGQYAVFVMKDGTPTLTMVEVGLQTDTFAEIKSGLQAGEVVTTGIVETNQ
jgi:RND family efflux transporter MFP subunit